MTCAVDDREFRRDYPGWDLTYDIEGILREIERHQWHGGRFVSEPVVVSDGRILNLPNYAIPIPALSPTYPWAVLPKARHWRQA